MSTLRVNTIQNTTTTDGGISIDTSGHVSIDGQQLPSSGQLSNRNKIINGSMEVAQRGTSSTANGYVSLDRWSVNQSGGSTTFSQETFAAGSEIQSLKNYAKLDVSASSDYTSIFQRIEDVRTVPAGSIAVSFWAKGTAPSGDLSVWFVQNFGSGGSADVDGTPQTVTLTSSWQRFTLEFTVASTSGKTIGASSFFQIQIGQHSNTGTTAWELDITGVQLEVGETATPFEHRSYGDELARCMRYFEQLTVTKYPMFPAGNSGVNSETRIPFHVQKRAAPTVTKDGDFNVFLNGSVSTNTDHSFNGTVYGAGIFAVISGAAYTSSTAVNTVTLLANAEL